MLHRKWKETKQQPGTAGPGNILCCCLVYLRFLCEIHSIHSIACGHGHLPPGKTYLYTIHPCAAHGLLSVQRRVGRVAELAAAEAGLCGQEALDAGVGARSGDIVRASAVEGLNTPERGV